MPRHRKPKLCFHKGTGQYYVRLAGEIKYLSVNAEAARDQYDDLMAEWILKQDDTCGWHFTIDELSLWYLSHCQTYYRKDGEPTREVGNVRTALRPLIAIFGPTHARDFRPKKLKRWRDSLITRRDARCHPENAKTLSRQYINKLHRIVVRMFRWAVSEELVPSHVYEALRTVEGLKKRRTDARESHPVRLVADFDVDAVVPQVVPQVAAMIRLQRLTGMRPGEVMVMRPCDVTMRTDEIWVYRPGRHKNEHHDQDRIVLLGPKAQTLLRPWLNREPSAYCFSPREAIEWLNVKKREERKTPVQPSQRDRSKKNARRKPGESYSENAYRQAIRRAIERVNETRREHGETDVPFWTPNQLRHTCGTVVRKKFGLEASQVILGHAKADVTQIYSERDLDLASKVAREVG